MEKVENEIFDPDKEREDRLLRATIDALNERIERLRIADINKVQEEVDAWAKLCGLIKINTEHLAIAFEIDTENAEDFLFWINDWEKGEYSSHGGLGLYYSPKTGRFIRVIGTIEHGVIESCVVVYYFMDRQDVKWLIDEVLEQFF